MLSLCGRGHTFEDTVRASAYITGAGLELVGQMMTGLPGASKEDETETARKIVSLGACAARIYPTVVFKGTRLSEMAESGEYRLLSRGETVDRCEAVFRVFVKAGGTLYA